MNNINLKIGDILTFSETKKSYRIIYIDLDNIELCELNTSNFILKFISTNLVIQDIALNKIKHENFENQVPDISLMPDNIKNKYERNKKIVSELTALYGPTFELLSTKTRKPELEKIIEKYDIDRRTLRRLYVKYIQSGFSLLSLVDSRNVSNVHQIKSEYNFKKRNGRKSSDSFASKVILTNKVRSQFDEAIKEKLSGRCKTYDSAYSWLVNKYYSDTFIENGTLIIQQKPESQIPTLKQFTNYARKKISKKQQDITNTSFKEVRNDKRLLLGDSFNDVMGAGDLVEIDALEVDVSLVSSSNRNIAIGRPILYLMIDVFTRMILAISVSLHNNSMIGLTNLFLNLSDDKFDFCEKYGFSINEDSWKSNIIPRRIRVDRGADFESNQFGEICEELGIDRQLLPAAMGSLKGSVEQEFKMLHSAIKPHLDSKGVISKRYDSKHHEEAILTIEEFTQMCIDFVLHHNTMSASEYPYTAEMIAEGVHAIPAELWAYSQKKYGVPRPIINIDAYRYALMKKGVASLDRTGITYQGLSYINTQDKDLLVEMYELQNKKKKMAIRIDPRNVGQIYYLKNGKLQIAQLNKAKTQNIGFEEMTLFELEEFNKEKKRLKKEGEIQNRRAKNSLFATEEIIVQTARATTPKQKNETKNLSQNRNIEKQRIAKENSIASRLDKDIIEASEPIETTYEEIKENTTSAQSGIDGFKEAMELFNNED